MAVDSFGMLPTYIARHAALSPGAKALAGIVSTYEGGSADGCFASLATLARDLNVTRRHAKRLLDELLEYRCVLREARPRQPARLYLQRNASLAVAIAPTEHALRRVPTRRPHSAGIQAAAVPAGDNIAMGTCMSSPQDMDVLANDMDVSPRRTSMSLKKEPRKENQESTSKSDRQEPAPGAGGLVGDRLAAMLPPF